MNDHERKIEVVVNGFASSGHHLFGFPCCRCQFGYFRKKPQPWVVCTHLGNLFVNSRIITMLSVTYIVFSCVRCRILKENISNLDCLQGNHMAVFQLWFFRVFSKGISQSALPYRRSVPTWLKLTADDVKEQIFKLGKKGLTPSQIGTYFSHIFPDDLY